MEYKMLSSTLKWMFFISILAHSDTWETVMTNNKDLNLAEGFDAFLHQQVSANMTCGSPAEQYYNTREGYVAPRHRVLSICDANNPLVARPPKYMTDGNDSTSWQSTNNVDRAYITITLDKPVFGKQILFKFGNYRRPGQIAIFKSSDYGKTYMPWHYLVSERQQCTSVFGIPESQIFSLPDEKINRVLCQEYTGYPFEYNEEILIELNGEIRGDGSNVYESQQLLKWMNATNVHIQFSGLYRKFDYIDTRWHHYVVNGISMVGRCDCNGHGDGILCPRNPNSGRRTCKCYDNTCGDNCQICCPFYNQYPWKRGSRSSWIPDNTTQCEQCNCHGHSQVCRYDENVALRKLSLDKGGEYKGGGVCVNCQHNTEGVNCEKCKDFFYRPLNVEPTSVNACPACGCSLAGSRATATGIKYLSCVRDIEMAKLFPGKTIGDCFCKQHVMGSKCETCMDGFYRLEMSNLHGCRPCSCSLDGTVQRLNICHKDFFGQCPCKANVKLRDCSICKDGYYDLRNDDVNGCKWCDCDVGASISPYICDKVTGECTCRAHITGRTCRTVMVGYYFPHMHYIFGRRNVYMTAKSTLHTTLKIPHNAFYRIYIGYILSEADRSAVLTLQLKLLGTTAILFQPNYPISRVDSCTEECFKEFKQEEAVTFFLNAGVYNVEILSSYTSSNFLLERVIAIPVEFLTASILHVADKAKFLSSCNVANNDLQIGMEFESICMAGAYSMTIKFEDGALPCKCNPTGSVNTTCNKFGGQCHCKEGVGGRDCSYCLPGYYDFDTEGCKACGCKGDNKVCDPVSGQCQCPGNTQGLVCDPCRCNGNSLECQLDGICLNCQFDTTGDHCEFCKVGFYGNALVSECSACNCHPLGAFNQSCNLNTGQCYCRPGVVGKTCNECKTNYFGLGITGCSMCNCNMFGSKGKQCAETGQCPCYDSAQGLKCEKCRMGYFGLPSSSCKECLCNTTGTILNTNCVNDEFGQCDCKGGVEGRACDRCMKQYAGFGVNGCKQCPLCTRQLQGHADDVAVRLDGVKEELNLTRSLVQIQHELKKTEDRVTKVEVNAALFNYRLVQGQNDYTRLQNSYLMPLNNRLTSLITQINSVTFQASQLSPIAANSGSNMILIYKSALEAAAISRESDTLATTTFSHLVDLNSRATNIIGLAYQYVQTSPTFNFEGYEGTIDQDLALSNFILGNITNIRQQVMYQKELSVAYLNALNKSEKYFKNKEKQWEGSKAAFLQNIQNVYAKGKDVEILLNQTRDLIDSQKQFIVSTENQQEKIKTLLSQTNTLCKETLGVYEKIRMHTQKITGGVEVLFLQYNPQNSIVRVNVLRGYHLVPRDYPSLKSDPYFKLSISPKLFNQGPLEAAPQFATLDPTWEWPIGGTYTFFITSEQMKTTKLIISVYDYDSGSEDDFMGEVVIDLNQITPIITKSATQKSYSLEPQGYASIWTQTVPVLAVNGLLDLQTMLSEQLVLVESLLLRAEQSYSKAETKANSLQADALALSSTFQQAKKFASRAVNAVNTYNEIYRLINSSLDAAVAANKSVQSITNILNGISVSSFTSKANAELIAAQQFLSQTRNRNLSYPSFEIYLRSATYGSPGVESPPQSSIRIKGIEYHPKINGHTVVIVDYATGNLDQVRTYRTDIDQTAGTRYEQFLRQIPTGKVVIIVKQGEGSINAQYQSSVMNQLLELGGQSPFFSGHRGSYILLGYRRKVGDVIPWITQVAKAETKGVSELRRIIYLKVTLQELLTTANQTFYSALPQWNEINQLFPSLKNSVKMLIQESSTAPVVQAALEAANVVISQAVSSATSVYQQTQILLTNVNELIDKYNYLKSASANVTSVINNGKSLVVQAENKLQLQKNYLLQTSNLQVQFTTISNTIRNVQSRMDSKLMQLQTLSSQMPFTIEYQQGGQSVFNFGVSSLTQHMYTVVQFDVKVKTTDGILWYLFSKTTSTTGSMGLYMQGGYLYLVYNLGYGNIVGKTATILQINRWYTVFASRTGHSAVLLLRDDIGVTTVKHLKSPYASDPNYFNIDGNSRWYLNGFPAGFMSQLTTLYGRFYGAYDNFIFNGVLYNLWNSHGFSGSLSYANYRYALPKKTDGSAVTFFGNGYIRHNVGTFSTSNEFSSLELEFRSLRNNVVVFGVTGQTGSFIYGLYIYGGKLMFQFATSLGNNIAIVSNNNFYNNGDWYKVTVSRSSVNATLHVIPLNPINAHLVERKTDYIGVTSLRNGMVIIFGAASSDSIIPPPVSGTFAGDMRSLLMSDSVTGELRKRSFSSALLVQQKDTSYYGMITGQIVQGIRFYGYMWWLKQGSYAMLMNYQNVPVNSIFISFKTTQLSGLLIYKEGSSSQPYFYVGLLAGNIIVLLQQKGNPMQPYVTTDLMVSNGQWHNMSLAVTNSGYQLQVDNKVVYLGWYGTSIGSSIGVGLVYVGGTPVDANLQLAVPTMQSLAIDFDSFLINRVDVNFFEGAYIGVSYAGIKPGSNQASPPPSCAASFPDLIYAPDPLQVRFGKVPWASIQSYIGYRLTDNIADKYFRTSYVVTMSFRAVSGDGVIFYIADSISNPKQYVSLELINGRIRYEFNNGEQKVTIETANTTNYAGTGKWYKVYLLRIYQFGAVLVPDTMEYKNSRHDQAAKPIQLRTPLYIGALPDHVAAPHFHNKNKGFNGCLRKFEVSSGFETYAFDFSKPDLGGTQTGTTSCYSNTEPGVYFNGIDAWVNYATQFQLKTDFDLEIRFRTYKRSGVLLYLFGRDSQTGVESITSFGSYILLELKEGKIYFHYKPVNLLPGQTFQWSDPKSDVSYYLCDQKWHTIRVIKNGRNLSIKVDTIDTLGGGVINENLSGIVSGHMYIGGVGKNIFVPTISPKHFHGCMELMSLGDQTERITSSENGNNVVFGCPTF